MNNLIKSVLTMLLLTLGVSQTFAEQKVTFYHYDLLGSPVATTDENGDVIWREEYSPWGEKLLKEDEVKEPDNVRGYTGHVNDKETGLTYMQARYYDPQIGRFMGVDPVGFQESNSISFNRYNYANNNPYKFTDPNGETPLGDEKNELDKLDQEKEEARESIKAFMTDKKVGHDFLKGIGLSWVAGGMTKFAKGKVATPSTALSVKGLVGNPMYKHALSQYKRGGWTNAGRHATKHPNILGVHVPKDQVQKALIDKFGSQGGVNRAAASALKNIMRNGVRSTKPTKAYGNVTQFKLNSGLGARFNTKTNEFIGFLGRGL